MQLVATLNNKFFRAVSTTETTIELDKKAMLKDQEGLDFQVMTNEEFDQWLIAQ